MEGGLENTLYGKPRPGAVPKITGEIEAQLTLLACSAPPEGRSRWTLQLLASKTFHDTPHGTISMEAGQ